MKNSNGFTLVELSIVLVIIGLLIGGILVAQSMIGTAKVQALTRQISQFDIAVVNFKTKYNQIPGDTNLMGTVPGNNNGIIGSFSGSSTLEMGGEMAKFWADLTIDSLKNPSGSGYLDDSSGSNSGLAASSYSPVAVAGTQAVFIAYGSGIAGTNFYHIGQRSARTRVIQLATAFKPADLLSIDSKIDDGIANAGEVKGINQTTPSATAQSLTGSLITGGTCATAANYNVTETTDTCNIRVRMGLTAGQPL